MSVKLITGTVASQELGIDTNGNISVVDGLAQLPAAGGYYTVAGQTSAVVAATLAANTTLMSARFSAGSSRKAYVTKFRTLIGVGTVGASAVISGTLGLQRFSTATPTGGTARTPNENDEAASATDMTDVRDSNAALTVTSVVFGNVVGVTLVPMFITSGAMWLEWIFEPNYPIKLNAGDGLCLRTQVVMPATQTWMFNYTMHWFEK